MREKCWWLVFVVLGLVHCPGLETDTEPKASLEEISIQPGSEGTDVWITSDFDYGSDYGVDNEWLQAGGWADWYYPLIKFDLSGLPEVATNATLWLYCLDRKDSSVPVGMTLHPITGSWDENTGWFNQPSVANSMYSLPTPVENSWYTIELTDLYNDWQSGAMANHGIELRPESNHNQFSVFASSDYYRGQYGPSIRPILAVEEDVGGESFTLLFPLAGESPYTARVVAVFDNDRKKGIVKAYNGEIGSVNPYIYGSKKDPIIGYQKVDGSDFILDLLDGYEDEVSQTGRSYIFYDNHSGYDYPKPIGIPILAAESGQLAIATKVVRPLSGDSLWRNNDVCKLPNGMDDQWLLYHAIFIKHRDTSYSSWYLHVSALDQEVRNQILFQGYAEISRGQTIASVGDYGVEGHPHLHFGLRLNDGLIDPYGTGDVRTANEDIQWTELP